MTTQYKIARAKLSILELAEYLKNVSQACRINGVPETFPTFFRSHHAIFRLTS